MSVPTMPVVDAAAAAASEAADRAQVSVRELATGPELIRAADLLAAVWRATPISSDLLQALSFAGNYVAGAWDGEELVGASVGFLGRDHGVLHLHSHITGVSEAVQCRSVGLSLKLHQRAWALGRGIDSIVWTFDPLVRRNAYFNLVKLRAAMVDYRPFFYPNMHDGINDGDESDRAVIAWNLTDSTDPVDPNLARAAIVLRPAEDGSPLTSEPGDQPLVRAWIPEDIVSVRRNSPPRALEWRRALRSTMGRAVASGYHVVSITRDGWYVMERTR